MRNSAPMIPRVRPEELKFAVGIACAAAAMKGPYATPPEREFTVLDEETGEESTYRFANDAAARGAFAVMQQFEHDPRKALALLMRWSELTRLISDHRMKPYLRASSDGSSVDLRPEVLDVAAELVLDGDKGFDTRTFFRTLDARVSAAIMGSAQAA
jgi:hypothetical protein